MNEWETKRLMTWGQFEETFKPICESWYEYNFGYSIKYNELNWFIHKEMLKYFGTEIKVKDWNITSYTYHDSHNWAYHESWFEPEFEEFLTEEEMII